MKVENEIELAEKAIEALQNLHLETDLVYEVYRNILDVPDYSDGLMAFV